MILPASYHSGFAPRDGQPLYPELWRGCVGAWAPCLGPTGLTLRDWSGYGNHGGLTNMTPSDDYVIRQGRYSLEFDNSDDFVDCGSSDLFRFGGTPKQPFTVSACFATYDINDYSIIACKYNAASNTGWLVGVYNQRVFIQIDGVYTNLGGVVTLNRLHYLCGTWDGSNLTVYLDGKQPNTVSLASNVGASDNMRISSCDYGGVFAPMNGLVYHVSVHRGAWHPSLVALNATRPGIAYEIAPRRRSSILVPPFRAAWLNQRSQIIGGGVR